jgi:hypothetical protein
MVTNSPDEWERTFNICWGGVYNCTRAFLPMLQKAEEGHIVNTSNRFLEDIVVATRDVRVTRLMAEVEQERQPRLKAEQRASGLKSANRRLQSTVLKLKAQVMDSASPTRDRE